MCQRIYVCVYQLLKLMGLYLSSGSGHLVCIKTNATKVGNVLHTSKMDNVKIAVLVGLSSGANDLEIFENIQVLWWVVAFMYVAGSLFVWRSDIE